MDTLFPILAAIVVGIAPPAITLYVLKRRKQRYHEEALEPFTEMPLRPPGESTRQKLEALSEESDGLATTLIAASAIATAMLCTAAEKRFLISFLGVAIFVSLLYLFTVPKLLRLIRETRNYRLGFTGERVVGEHLNQLLSEGFHVFHDLDFGKYNIDHVIVGPPGVYAVETKTRRKPLHLPGSERATVTYDGTTLHFPGWRDEPSVTQARRNAKSLSSWLSSATAQPVPVQAILTLPGWFVQRRAISDVNVLNPVEISRCFPRNPKPALTPQQIQQIVHHLTERCRLSTDTPTPSPKAGTRSLWRSRRSAQLGKKA